MTSAADRAVVASGPVPQVPRLRLELPGDHATLLDGGWWPRSTDPLTELPGLIVALDGRRGVVSSVALGVLGWDSRPRRLDVAGRTVRLGWFASQPAGLLTATYRDGGRVDVVVVPPGATAEAACAAMALATAEANSLHAPEILAAVRGDRTPAHDGAECVWEGEGGRLRRNDDR